MHTLTKVTFYAILTGLLSGNPFEKVYPQRRSTGGFIGIPWSTHKAAYDSTSRQEVSSEEVHQQALHARLHRWPGLALRGFDPVWSGQRRAALAGAGGGDLHRRLLPRHRRPHSTVRDPGAPVPDQAGRQGRAARPRFEAVVVLARRRNPRPRPFSAPEICIRSRAHSFLFKKISRRVYGEIPLFPSIKNKNQICLPLQNR